MRLVSVLVVAGLVIACGDDQSSGVFEPGDLRPSLVPLAWGGTAEYAPNCAGTADRAGLFRPECFDSWQEGGEPNNRVAIEQAFQAARAYSHTNGSRAGEVRLTSNIGYKFGWMDWDNPQNDKNQQNIAYDNYFGPGITLRGEPGSILYTNELEASVRINGQDRFINVHIAGPYRGTNDSPPADQDDGVGTGIAVANSSGWSVDSSTVRGFGGYGVTAGQVCSGQFGHDHSHCGTETVWPYPAAYDTIRNSRINKNGRGGIYGGSGNHHWVIDNNVVDWNGRNGIDVNGYSFTINNNEVLANGWGDPTNPYDHDGIHIWGAYSPGGHHVITNNTVYDNYRYGIGVLATLPESGGQYVRNIDVANNEVYGNIDSGIALVGRGDYKRLEDVRVIGNELWDNGELWGGGYGIYFDGRMDGHVSSNSTSAPCWNAVPSGVTFGSNQCDW